MTLRFKQIIRYSLMAILNLFLMACSHVPDRKISVPDSWQLNSQQLMSEFDVKVAQKSQEDKVLNDWLSPLLATETVSLANQLLSNSAIIKQAYFQLKLSDTTFQQIVRAARPTLDLGLSKQRSLSNENFLNSYDVSLRFNWVPDVWRRLNAEQRAAKMRVMQSALNFKQISNTQVAELLKLWVQGIESSQVLEEIKAQRITVLNQMDVITDNYVLGQGRPRDVLQSRENKAAINQRVSVQENLLQSIKRNLLLTIGNVSGSSVSFSETFSIPDKLKIENISLKYILNRQDVKREWLELAALDFEVAAAHRSRFPTINFSLNSGFRGENVNSLFDGPQIFWTLLGGITQPLFDQKRLKTQYQQSVIRSKQQEQVYLYNVQRAMTEIHTIRDQLLSFEQQIKFALERESAAEDNEIVAIEQYLLGLEIYENVLLAQQNLLDAKISNIQLNSQYAQACVDLFIALGGGFNALEKSNEIPSVSLRPQSTDQNNDLEAVHFVSDKKS